jgi:hypothetical protein
MAEKASADLKRAAALYRNGDRTAALKALGQALESNPALAQVELVQTLASRITGLNTNRVLSLLADHEQREAFIRKHGSSAGQSSFDVVRRAQHQRRR